MVFSFVRQGSMAVKFLHVNAIVVLFLHIIVLYRKNNEYAYLLLHVCFLFIWKWGFEFGEATRGVSLAGLFIMRQGWGGSAPNHNKKKQ